MQNENGTNPEEGNPEEEPDEEPEEKLSLDDNNPEKLISE